MPCAYVNFSAEINASTAENLMALMARHANEGTEEVRLLLSTPGGQVMAGITGYNFLRALPFRLVIHNAGNIDSIGNAIFLAGPIR
jgi:ATP-dependent protease ClpP protease subunit